MSDKLTNREILTVYSSNCYNIEDTIEDIDPDEIKDEQLKTLWYEAKNIITDLVDLLEKLETDIDEEEVVKK